MVPINFYQYREKLRQALLAQWDQTSSEGDAFIAAWIAYALSHEGIEGNKPLEDLTATLKQRRDKDQVWEQQRNLGPVAFSCWLEQQMGMSLDITVATRLSDSIKSLKADGKLSLLRDPEQVFLLALGLSAVEDGTTGVDEAKARLIEVAKQEVKNGPLRRKILYAAALREMGESITLKEHNSQDSDIIADIIALVWWAERYPGELKKNEHWKRFASIIEMISFEDNEAGKSRQVLLVPDQALLYEAVCRETSQPDPILLFEYFPLHPRVRNIARDHYYNGKYVTAVEQACKVLNELIQNKSGISDKSEVELVQATMKQISNPTELKIKFNKFLREKSGKNEQSGLAEICEGIFKAFRNPKGHKPEDHPLVQMEPYEALCQLIIISYLMERVEKANANDPDNAGSM